MSEHKAADFTDAPKRQHVSDAAWEQYKSVMSGLGRGVAVEEWEAGAMEATYREMGLKLVTVEEWGRRETQTAKLVWLRAHLADCYAWIDELEARLRVPNSGTNAPKSRTGALLLTREADARLGWGDAGEER